MSASVYKTKQRKLVEQILKETDGRHITVDKIVDKLSCAGSPVGRTTVYRCLERMIEDGTVRKYSAEPGESACYQYINGEHCEEHFHLKCTECGRLIHIDCNHIKELAEHIEKEHGFRVDRLKTVLYGVCEDCAKK